MKHSRHFKGLNKALLAIAFTLLGIAGFSKLVAQPVGYCVPYPNSSITYQYCYYYYSDPRTVQIIDVSTGTQVGYFNSGDIGTCWKEERGYSFDLKLGRTYRMIIGVYAQVTYYHRVRLFIDWNHNGSYQDDGDYMGMQSYYGGGNFTVSYDFTVPCSMDPEPTMFRVFSSYYYDQGKESCYNGYLSLPSYNYVYGGGKDYVMNIIADIEGTFPNRGGILFTDEDYDGTQRVKDGVTYDFKKPSVTMGQTQPSGSILTYQIQGPRPSTNVVYEGLNPSDGNRYINMGGYRTYTMSRARGPNAINSGDGSVKFYRGGEYKVAASISGSGCPGEIYNPFTASWDDDMQVIDAVEPKNNAAPKYQRYLRGQTLNVKGLYQNSGLNEVSEFMAYACLLNSSGDTIWSRSYHYSSYDNPADNILYAGDKKEVSFGTVKINTVGLYRLYFRVALQSGVDQESFNDIYPRSGDPAHTVEITYEIQLQSNRFIFPKQGMVLIGNRPVTPIGEFKNVGANVASNVPAKIRVFKLPRTGQLPAYEATRIILDVPEGKYNIKVEDFDMMSLKESGTYEAELIISHPEDAVPEDDTVKITFTVEGGLSGRYTVGTTYGGSATNFSTIDSAMNALFYRGLAGPVVFELTDASYIINGTSNTQPAWDFTSHMINLGYDAEKDRYNTITWQPSIQRSLSRGSITITINTPSGIAIGFGQSMSPSNKYAIYNEYSRVSSLAKKYSNNQGYITFNGGSQKSFKFRINSTRRAFGTGFYLHRGSSNISILNCLIENINPSHNLSQWLPRTTYSQSTGFGYSADSLLSGNDVYSYSAGISSRATVIRIDTLRLYNDTLPNKNNLFKGNEISSFGYGIVSLGYGQFWMENEGEYRRFYNQLNEYSNNTIYNCSKAGMFFGYEENSKILNNKIYNIGNANNEAAGILGGGEHTQAYRGYNNIGLKIDGNEISQVTSGIESNGIKLIQSRNEYPHPRLTVYRFPDVPEELMLTNNIVWGVTTSRSNANRFGINVQTERGNDLKTPYYDDYFTRNDKIANNTIIMGANGGLITTGSTAGISLLHSKGGYLRNNATALTDIAVDISAPIYSHVLYEGPMPQEGGVSSDRNVYWSAAGSNASLFRFYEIDELNRLIDEYDRDAFKNLTQWRNWTNQDHSSAFGNFVNDLTYLGAEPNQRLRVITTPNTPLGSYLNNRGEIVSLITKDIDGNTRGQAGQRYDVGACEFTGRMYISDVEMLDIIQPTAYKANYGTYSDAEYVMTKAPVNVKANVRNNGNIEQAGIAVTATIYRELPNGTFSTSPELTKVALVNIPSSETVTADFMLDVDRATGFMPKTFGDLRGQGYVVPDQFVTMEANVTPKYKIVVAIGSDQQNNNNTTQKIVRFYIQKSNMRILLSAEHSMLTLDGNSSIDEIAGRVNYDSVKKGMKKLGWIIDIDSTRFDYDVFDRFGWEPKAVNYRDYRTIVWSDGDDKPLTRWEKTDMQRFLDMGNEIEKKNLIIGSQEYVRENSAVGIYQDLPFVNEILRAATVAPENPMGAGVSNHGNWVIGMACERDLAEYIQSTWYPGDVPPYCGLMNITPTGDGLAKPAYYYFNRGAGVTDSLMGVATSTLTRNVIMLGVDWRHWGNISMLIRAFVDFVEKNGGTIIPVELLSFNAQAAGNRVDINWATASEYKSDRFEVERAAFNEAGRTDFAKIAEVKAAGNSSHVIKYGPIVDNNVNYGSKYAYRLKMIDLSGEWKYSSEVEVAIEGTGNFTVKPNPATTFAELTYSLTNDANTTIGIYDISGKLVMSLFTGNATAGEHTIMINTSNLTSGVYSIIINANGATFSKQLNVSR